MRRAAIWRVVRMSLLLPLLLLPPATDASAAPKDTAWLRAAARLEMPVFRPARTAGLRFRRLFARALECGRPIEELHAYYRRRSDGARLRVAEGRPFYCGDLGEPELAGRPLIHGRRARLYRNCVGSGCAGGRSYDLQWRERRVQITLLSQGLRARTLVRIARGMREVAS